MINSAEFSDVTSEYVGADLGDARLSRRLVKLGVTMASDAGQSFPDAFDEAGLAALYRFLNNEYVEGPRMLQPHVEATWSRAASTGADVLMVHDTTCVSFDPDGARRGLGRKRAAGQAFFVHAALAVGTGDSRVPLGVVELSPYTRDESPANGRERGRWFDQVKSVQESSGELAKRVIHVMDREADSYELMCNMQACGSRFVIRVSKERCLAEYKGKLFAATKDISAVFQRSVQLSSRAGAKRSKQSKKTHPSREARTTTLAVGARTVVLKRADGLEHSGLPKTYTVNVVRVWEPHPPANESPVEWLLFTSEPIETAEQLAAIVDAYRGRWRIEEFFKALKTGCSLELRQLESYDGLVRAMFLLAPLAWRLLSLRVRLTESPDDPARVLLDRHELSVLKRIARKPLPASPTCDDVVRAIAALGGHLKRNGDPGWITLARGLEHLLARVEGYKLAKKKGDKGICVES